MAELLRACSSIPKTVRSPLFRTLGTVALKRVPVIYDYAKIRWYLDISDISNVAIEEFFNEKNVFFKKNYWWFFV